jgi:hypothetical protein
MPLYLAPVCNGQTFDANGDPLNGGQIETYLAGSSTPAATYTDDTGGTPQSNPIILNSLGYPTLGPIWLTGGVSYKFVIKDSLGVTLRTIDDISGVNDASVSQSEWLESGLVPTYINATSFSVPGDQTMVLQTGRRIRTQNTSGFIYSTISNSVFAAGITTVTVVNDSGTLDAGLTLVAYALLAATPLSVPDLPGSKITGAYTASAMTVSTSPRVLGRVTGGSGAVEELTAAQLASNFALRGAYIVPISASVGSNALTVTLNPTTLDFRSSTLGDGTVNTRVVSSPVSMTVSSGSTLGTISAQGSRIIVLALDNAGTVELAVVNLAGGVNLDETSLISTTAEGGAGGADSATTVYSTTARTSVPYRVLGFVDSTQATAGTWATAPSLVSGTGGMVLGAMQSLGFGQTWQSVTRTAGVTYYNTTGKPLGIEAVINGASASCSTSIVINGGPSFVFVNAAAGTGPVSAAGMFLIPAWGSYVLSDLNVSARSTYELR